MTFLYYFYSTAVMYENPLLGYNLGMPKVNRINYDESLVLHLIANIVAKTPGVDIHNDFNVTINDSHTVLNIVFKPLSYVVDVFQLARKIQDIVYFNVKKTFDLYNVVVNVEVKGN